jgi:hypothetical protein
MPEVGNRRKAGSTQGAHALLANYREETRRIGRAVKKTVIVLPSPSKSGTGTEAINAVNGRVLRNGTHEKRQILLRELKYSTNLPKQ